MSRIIKIFSEQIEEVDLATEVVKELGLASLKFNKEKQCFENQQYDDISNNTIQKAENLYYEKRITRNTALVQEALKKSKYKVTLNKENNKTKIVAVQRVYA